MAFDRKKKGYFQFAAFKPITYLLANKINNLTLVQNSSPAFILAHPVCNRMKCHVRILEINN